MVRLGVNARMVSQAICWFQFQHGAIGSGEKNGSKPREICFNSSMVRLGVFYLCQTTNMASFNSSMVRLGDSENYFLFADKEFQFQHGAIGSPFEFCHPRRK